MQMFYHLIYQLNRKVKSFLSPPGYMVSPLKVQILSKAAEVLSHWSVAYL